MNFSNKEYQLIIIVFGITILALSCLQFEIDDVVKASFEDESDVVSSWHVRDVDYRDDISGGKNTALVTVTFFNNKPVYDEWKEEEAICELFKFRVITETIGGVLPEKDIEIDYGDYHGMLFVFRDIPDGTKENIEIRAKGYDENGSSYELQEVLIVPIEIPDRSNSEPTPGFEAVFAIAGLLAAIYLIKRK